MFLTQQSLLGFYLKESDITKRFIYLDAHLHHCLLMWKNWKQITGKY